MDWSPLILSFELAFFTTLLLLCLAFPLAYWLAFTKAKTKPIIETLVSMPLVLPPTVIGFYLLIAFSPNYAFGQMLENFLGFRLVFSFQGLVLASVFYSMPFMVQPLQSGLSNLPISLIQASDALGKSRLTAFFKILLPNVRPSILTGVVLTFAHTIGEFGIVLMIGGNIPGRTKVAAIAIYNEVEMLNYAVANTYAAILCVLSFIFLFIVYTLNQDYLNVKAGR